MRWKNGQIEHYEHFETSTFNKISSKMKWIRITIRMNQSLFLSFILHNFRYRRCFSTFLAFVAGRRKGGGKVKMSAGGRRDGLQGHYCFLCFFRPRDERKNLDWSDLIDYLIHTSDWLATCHSKPLRSSHILYIQQCG